MKSGVIFISFTHPDCMNMMMTLSKWGVQSSNLHGSWCVKGMLFVVILSQDISEMLIACSQCVILAEMLIVRERCSLTAAQLSSSSLDKQSRQQQWVSSRAGACCFKSQQCSATRKIGSPSVFLCSTDHCGRLYKQSLATLVAVSVFVSSCIKGEQAVKKSTQTWNLSRPAVV